MKTKGHRRQGPNVDPNTMSAALVLDPRELEIRVRELTKPLSLRQASPSRYVEREESSISSSTEAHLVLDRIQEMEQRQHWFEALLGGAGPDNDELESLRFKRLALEESQAALEQELKQVRRKMRSETTGPAPVHGKSKKQPCTNCSKLGIERTRLEGKELALQVKEGELQTKMQEASENERRLQERQRQLEASWAQLAAEKDKFQQLKSVGGAARNGVDETSLAQREVALMRQKHEVSTERNQQQVELKKLEAARNQHQKELRELEAARKALQQEQATLKAAQDLQRRTTQQRISSSEMSALLRGKQEMEAERFRLNQERKELNSERRVLEANFRVLETQRRELLEAQTALENSNDNQPKKCSFPFCCFSL